jgi:hypothetical protein
MLHEKWLAARPWRSYSMRPKSCKLHITILRVVSRTLLGGLIGVFQLVRHYMSSLRRAASIDLF